MQRLSAKAGQNDRPHGAYQKILALRSRDFRSTKLVTEVGYNAGRDQENAKVTNFRLAKADRAHYEFTLPLAVFCFLFFPLCAQWVFADDIYIYKDKNGVLTFTSVPTHAGYPRVIRGEDKPETSTGSSHAESKSTFVRLFRLKDTGEIGYWDGEQFISLWPERYTKLMDDNTAFANPNEYEDIWVNGLSEQAGPIKMRKGLPPAVTAAAIDWLIEQNLDKYKPKITSPSSRPRTNSFIIAFVIILLASLPILFVRDRYKNLATILFFMGTAMYKYALFNRCHYCKTRTENDSRICNECQIRLDTEKAKAQERERQERERRTGADKNSERERAAEENGFDPYQVLRITTGASKEEIKAAYFNLIKQYHPDKVSHLGLK
jgi:DnaJ domain